MSKAPTGPAAESELIERLVAGDEAAFTQLVGRFHPNLVRFALAFVRDRSVAEEVVQDTWLAVVKGLASFERRSSLKTWIFRIAANRARTRGVREARSTPLSAFESRADGQGPAVDPARFDERGRWTAPPRRWEEQDPEKLLMRGETMEVLQRALDGLPPNQRTVVVLRDIEGLESAEICNILEVSETNLRVLLHRGRVRLRAVLEEHLGR